MSDTPQSNIPGEKRRPSLLLSGVMLKDGRYRIEQPLSAGPKGAVYRVWDLSSNVAYAMKEAFLEILDDASHVDGDVSPSIVAFAREATVMRTLDHPCFPQVHDFFVEEKRCYLILDLIRGRTLSEVLVKEGHVVGLNGARGITEARARHFAQQLCDALHFLHRQTPSILFRDLKPSKVMVTEQDEVRLVDFGLARRFQSQQKPRTVIMTLGYIAPEQVQGKPEPRSDIYSLGATLYRLLTSRDAKENTPIFVFPPLRSLRPDVSPAFEHIVMKAVSPALESRWFDCQEMERAIANLPPLRG